MSLKALFSITFFTIFPENMPPDSSGPDFLPKSSQYSPFPPKSAHKSPLPRKNVCGKVHFFQKKHAKKSTFSQKASKFFQKRTPPPNPDLATGLLYYTLCGNSFLWKIWCTWFVHSMTYNWEEYLENVWNFVFISKNCFLQGILVKWTQQKNIF